MESLKWWLPLTSYSPTCSPHYLPFTVGLFDADRIYGGQFVTVLAKGLDPAIDIALWVPCQPRLLGHCKNTCVNNINFLACSYKLLNKEKYECEYEFCCHRVRPFEFIGILLLLLWHICVLCVYFGLSPKVLDLRPVGYMHIVTGLRNRRYFFECLKNITLISCRSSITRVASLTFVRTDKSSARSFRKEGNNTFCLATCSDFVVSNR